VPVDSAQLDHLFTAALAQTAPGARAAYLDQACAANPDLRERLDNLLAAHDAAGSFLELPDEEATTPFVTLNERPGTTIGRYKLLEQIGEGGFGVVFMAEQEHPVRRRVALKVIKLGMDTKQVVARFEAERQALAMMDHPNIAKVFDAGATEAGRPYFVMELVRGVPITSFCDESRLTTDQRLMLFQTVCAAVQHAHQKGIIHRDLKPTNVLVTMHDDKAVPKVIDFGVAKATQSKLTERTLFTEFRQMIGTPSYMSPEQAHMSGLDVDTRSDIYSLGVLLYELLTGSTPIDGKQLRNSSYDDLRRLICEFDPPRPSARLSTLPKEALTTLAQVRRCDTSQLAVNFRGDLDWIVLRCLEKDRKRRYPTANSLALDVQRFLSSEPVEARPPSNVYRVKKFAQRNRVKLSVAGLVLLFLMLLGGGAGWTARDNAARRSALSQNVSRLLEESSLWQEQGRWPEARSTAERANTLIASNSADARVIDRVEKRLADINLLVKLDDIRGLCESGEELAIFTRGDADRAYAAAFRDFGIDFETIDHAAAARQILQRSVSLEIAASLDHWALVRKWQLNPSQGEELLNIARLVDQDPTRNRIRDLLLTTESGNDHLAGFAATAPIEQILPATLVLLGTALESAGEREQAFELLQKSQQLYPNDFWINWRLANCAQLLEKRGEAIRYFTVAVALRPTRPEARSRLGGALALDGRFDEGLKEFERAIHLQPDYPGPYIALAWLLATSPVESQRNPKEAVKYALKAFELQPQLPNSYCNLGVAYLAAGDWKNALHSLEKANQMLDGEDYWHRFHLAKARWRAGHRKEARTAYQEGLEWLHKEQRPFLQELQRFELEAAKMLGIVVPTQSLESAKPL
jgi:serine/threonine protein kinase/Tfp pilus assembly protein PilF